MRRLGLTLLAVLAFAAAGGVAAHEVRPAYLALDEQSDGRVEVTWKQPTRGELALALEPKLPERCHPITERRQTTTGGALVTRWQTDCGTGGLDGAAVTVDGLAVTLTDVLLRVTFADGEARSWMLRPAEPSVELGRDGIRVPAYLALGVEHLLLGPDHLLFVIGLMLLVASLPKLVATITAFTVAHSITLAAAALAGVALPQAPVETAIALSILMLAVELTRTPPARAASLTTRAPWLVAFAFGLLHGFGFAGALEEIGLPEGSAPVALALFNVGIELGQLAIVAVLLLGLRLMRALPVALPAQTAAVPVYLMGMVAAYWVFDRLAGMLAVA